VKKLRIQVSVHVKFSRSSFLVGRSRPLSGRCGVRGPERLVSVNTDKLSFI
jgi:hypothetical protein